jgi:hypothetical protein
LVRLSGDEAGTTVPAAIEDPPGVEVVAADGLLAAAVDAVVDVDWAGLVSVCRCSNRKIPLTSVAVTMIVKIRTGRETPRLTPFLEDMLTFSIGCLLS